MIATLDGVRPICCCDRLPARAPAAPDDLLERIEP